MNIAVCEAGGEGRMACHSLEESEGWAARVGGNVEIAEFGFVVSQVSKARPGAHKVGGCVEIAEFGFVVSQVSKARPGAPKVGGCLEIFEVKFVDSYHCNKDKYSFLARPVRGWLRRLIAACCV